MESWQKAWNGPGQQVKPYEDEEWVQLRRDWLRSLPSGEGMSDEVAAENYRLVQAQWLMDHIEEVRSIDPDAAAQLEEMRD